MELFSYKKRIKNNSGFMLLGSLIVVVFLSIVLSAAVLRSEMQVKEATLRNTVQEAFYAAEAGLDRAIFELRRNLDWDPGEGDPPVEDVRLNRIPDDDSTTIGFYSVIVEDGGIYDGWETRWVQSVGRDSFNDMTRVIVARVLIDSPARFLVSTLGDLRIQSGANIDADILGTDVYFEVNPSLDPPFNAIVVNGEVFYIRSINGEDDPAVTIGGSHQTPSITFAGVNVDRYRELAIDLETAGEGIYEEGDLTVSLGALGSLPVPPSIVFAEGDVTISGDYDYSLLVVAGGDVLINGNIVPDENIPVRPQIGIFAKQDIIIPEGVVPSEGDLSIEALLIADGGGDSEGVFIAEGQGLGTFNFIGAISARGEGNNAINLNAFESRNYDPNPALTTSRTIPFLPFIANILEWMETTLADEFPPIDNMKIREKFDTK